MDTELSGTRGASSTLRAEWVTEEADLHAAQRVLPGSMLRLVRWPVAFCIAYVGVNLSDARVGPAFTFGSAGVITAAWLILSVAARGTRIRSLARRPAQERTVCIALDANRIRLESASAHASEFPASDLTHAKISRAGILLNVHGQPWWIPDRCVRGSEEEWQRFISGRQLRPWPRGVGFTAGLWLFALVVAVYGFLR